MALGQVAADLRASSLAAARPAGIVATDPRSSRASGNPLSDHLSLSAAARDALRKPGTPVASAADVVDGPVPPGVVPPLTSLDPGAPTQPGDMSLGKGFFIGTTTSATQVEGGGINNDITQWALTHKGWAAPNPGLDHWDRLQQDYAWNEKIGSNAHGFTVDWARIEPQPGVFDQAAIDHYKQELEICRKDGMEPMVTLLQYALPPWLAKEGGYLAPDATQRFAEFARVCAENFGDQVTWWATMNEPNTVAAAGYLAGLWPPGIKNPLKMMDALNAMLRMHAAAAQVLHDVAKEHHRKAEVGIVYIDDKMYPAQKWNPLDQIVTRTYDYVGDRWFIDSLASGKAIWPVGDGKTIPGLKGSIDYFGLNFYGRDWGHFNPFAGGDRGPIQNWPNPENKGEAFDSAGMYERLLANYNKLHVPMMITEDGVDVAGPDPQNTRGRALVDALSAIHHAQQDGVPVLGYLYWTDFDSPEWHDGYTQHYGLFGFDPKTGNRWDKPAAKTFEVIARRGAIPQQWLTPEDLQDPALRDSHAAHELKVLRESQQPRKADDRGVLDRLLAWL